MESNLSTLRKSSKTRKLITATFFLLYAVLIIMGFKQFHVWRQIHYGYGLLSPAELQDLPHVFRQAGDTLLIPMQLEGKGVLGNFAQLVQELSTSYIHMPRLLLMYPIMKIGKLLGVSYNAIFSLIGLCLIFLAWYCLISAGRVLSKGRYLISENLLLIGIMGFSFFFNGRLIWVFLSLSLLIYISALQRYRYLSAWKLVFSLSMIFLGASVATGSFIATYFCTLCWLLFFSSTKQNQPIVRNRIIIIIFLSLSFPYLLASMWKNLYYFGGDFEAILYMSNHGVGRYVFSLWGVVGFAALVVCLMIRRSLFPKGDIGFVLSTVVIGILCSCFGYSTLVVANPGSILMIYLRLSELVEDYMPNKVNPWLITAIK